MSEKDLITKLERLTHDGSFIFVLAFLSVIDFYNLYERQSQDQDFLKGLEPKNLDKIFSPIPENQKLIRSELNFLAGLMVKKPINLRNPTKKRFEAIYQEVRKLLLKIHEQIQQPQKSAFIQALSEKKSKKPKEPFLGGKVLREPIFYSAESAFEFQYRDFSIEKYSQDENWVLTNFGFTIPQACKIAEAINNIINDRINGIAFVFGDEEQFKQASFALGKVEITEICEITNFSKKIINNFFGFFSCKPGKVNQDFSKIGDFNEFEAKPIINLGGQKYFVISPYTLFQAIYESPFYYMLQDKNYCDKATENRGKFLENFVASKLEKIFGEENVFQNVKIEEKKGHTLTDIDVLVVFRSRALIFQTKTKRLTVASKLGNSQSIISDFEKAI